MGAVMPTEPVTVIAEFHARPGDEDHVRRTLAKMIEPTRREPGNIDYDLHQAKDDPTIFILYENWRSQADLDRHMQQPHLKRMDHELAGTLRHPYSVTLLTMISAREAA
jgi:quinol monooxygenase YgiN